MYAIRSYYAHQFFGSQLGHAVGGEWAREQRFVGWIPLGVPVHGGRRGVHEALEGLVPVPLEEPLRGEEVVVRVGCEFLV